LYLTAVFVIFHFPGINVRITQYHAGRVDYSDAEACDLPGFFGILAVVFRIPANAH